MIKLLTGALLLVGMPSTALAVVAVPPASAPEPGAFALLAVGAAALALTVRRRK